MEIKGIRRRTPRPKIQHRLVLIATELPDAEAARLGRGTRLAAVEAEQMRGFLRAGGAIVAHR